MTRSVLFLLFCLCIDNSYAQEVVDTTPPVRIDREQLPATAMRVVSSLNVDNARLGDVLRGLSLEYDVNVHVDDGVDNLVTARLVDLPVIEVLEFFADTYNLEIRLSGSIISIHPAPAPDAPPAPIVISFENDLLSYNLENASLDEVARAIYERSGINVVVRRGLSGSLSGHLQNVSFDTGLRMLAENNGFSVRIREGVYVLDRGTFEVDTGPEPAGWVAVQDGRVDIDVHDAPVRDVLREVSAQANLSMVTYELPTSSISVRADGLSIDQAIGVLLRGTGINFQKTGDVYVIGKHDPSGVISSRLIRLAHIRAKELKEQLPANLTAGATIHVSREHNGVIVQGPGDLLYELESYISALDQPMPQVIIEALVVDFEEVDFREFGFSLGRFGAGDSTGRRSSLNFGDGTSGERGISINLDNDDTKNALDRAGDVLGFPTIGRLPPDFHLRIRALENEGKARVLSRPQIATLSGHTAELSVGTTQYFLLKSSTPLQSGNQFLPVETERFEKIEANISLQVTPWVTATGEITTEIKPEFSTPVGSFDSSVPPTINTRVLDSTVRLRDGETIILGGLIQEVTDDSYNKVPVLGNIPVLGRIFRESSKLKRKSVLVIYLTPHVFYGDERDNDRWEALRNRLELPDPDSDNVPDGSTRSG